MLPAQCAKGAGTYDQGFQHPLPDEYPVRSAGRHQPTFMERGEPSPQHVPEWMPAFPDVHTYRHTPLHQGHEQDPVKQQEVCMHAAGCLRMYRARLHAALCSVTESADDGSTAAAHFCWG